MDMYSIYTIHAALEALENAHLDTETVDHDRFGVIVSSGIGGLKNCKIRMHERGANRINRFIPKALQYGSRKYCYSCGANGVCKSITTACASSNDAIGEAFREN